MKRLLALLLVAAVLLSCVSSIPASQEKVTVTRVIDGDTIVLTGTVGPDGAITWAWDYLSSTLNPAYMPKQ